MGCICTVIVFLLKLKRLECYISTGWGVTFIRITLFIFIFSYFLFSLGDVWRDWQTSYFSPLILVGGVLAVSQLPRKAAVIFFLIILTSQSMLFWGRYQEYFRPSDDPSLLTNEIKAVDWVYQKSDNQGFYVYSYLPSVYDYPYQYLFWWYGLKKYGFTPCEYATFPGAPGSFIPHHKYYQQPPKACANFRFLIIEPDKNEILRSEWLGEVRKGTTLIEETTAGRIKIEKRSF